jgi:hypothetical protein
MTMPAARPGANKERHQTLWAVVSVLHFATSVLYSTVDASPRPEGGCA